MSEYGNNTIMSLSHPLTSDDSDSDHTAGCVGARSPAPLQLARAAHLQSPYSGEGSASTATKKPRGRPPGSKNKPKPPVVITKESDSAMKPVVLEISAGPDVIEMVTGFARRRRVGVTLLSGAGTVSNVTLRHPMAAAHTAAPGSLISLHGPFHLLSLWGSFMGFDAKASASAGSSPSAGAGAQHGFGITLSGGQGQVFGGVVGGKVVAAGPVVVVATTFINPPIHRLPPPHEANDAGEGADEDGEKEKAAGKKRGEGGGFGSDVMCSPISALPPNY